MSGQMGHQKKEQKHEHVCECGYHSGTEVKRVLVLSCKGIKMRRYWAFRHPKCFGGLRVAKEAHIESQLAGV